MASHEERTAALAKMNHEVMTTIDKRERSRKMMAMLQYIIDGAPQPVEKAKRYQERYTK